MVRMSSPPSLRFGPVPASILAGFIGAGVADAVVTTARASGPSAPVAVFLLSIGLYGIVGLVAAGLFGFLVAGVLGAIPGTLTGPSPEAQRRDRQLATGVLAAAAGVVALAVAAALGHKIVVRPMQSDRLATIATAGLVLLLAPFAGALAIALGRPIGRWLTPRLPRPAATGTTGLLLLAAAFGGVLAAMAAFSLADWRVLDLSPFVALGLVVVAGVAHAIF